MSFIRATHTGKGFITHEDRLTFTIAQESSDVWEVSGDYQAWVNRVGGIPLTQPEIDAVMAARAVIVADAAAHEEAKADSVIQYLRDHTPAECEAYVQNNVTDLVSARAVMKKFAVVLSVLAKQALR